MKSVINEDLSINIDRLLWNYTFSNYAKTKIFHIKGSGNFNPSKAGKIIISNVNYFEIILGFIFHNDSSCWLTNKEISAGVIKAVESEKMRFYHRRNRTMGKHS